MSPRPSPGPPWHPPGAVGEQLSDYEIQRVVGAGMTGPVYRARRKRDGADAAIKVLDLARAPHVRDRLLREAELVTSLEHPALVPVLGGNLEHDPPFLAFRFLPGGDLLQYTQPGSLLPVERVVRMGLRIAGVLGFLHGEGILHRDLKPANILLDAGGEAYLADLGLGVRPEVDPALTATGAVVGTPCFMAPEVFRGEDASPSSDVYALAATLVELLTGARARPAVGNPAFDDAVLQDLQPPALRGALWGALRMEAEERTPDAVAFASQLERALEEGARAGLTGEVTLPPPDDVTRDLPPGLPAVITEGDRFSDIRPLGSGGMATVFRARDRTLGREVALKVVAESLLARPGIEARFRREAKVLAGTRHPNLVQCYDLLEGEGDLALVLEYLEGRDLQRVLGERGRLAIGEVRELVAQVGGAVDALHAAGVLHRDLKPANVFRAADGRWVLMDLGLAQGIGGTRLTATEVMVGTPLYLPPEVVFGGDFSKAGDVFALGAVAFEALTGRCLRSVTRLRKDHGDPRAWRPDLAPLAELEVPGEVAAALELAAAEDPATRPESCGAFAEMLRELPGVASTRPSTTDAWGPGSRTRPAVAAALAGVLAVAVLGPLARTLLTPAGGPATPPAVPAAADDLGPAVRLGPGPSLSVDVRRPLELGWSGGGPSRRVEAPGNMSLPLPTSDRGPLELAWSAGGTTWTRALDPEGLADRLEASLPRVPLQDLLRVVSGRGDSPELDGLLRAAPTAVAWAPRLLASPLAPARKRALLARLGRIQATLAQLPRTMLPELPWDPAALGLRQLDVPVWDSLGVELPLTPNRPTARREVELDGVLLDIGWRIDEKRRGHVEAGFRPHSVVHVTWPEVPADATEVALALEVSRVTRAYEVGVVARGTRAPIFFGLGIPPPQPDPPVDPAGPDPASWVSLRLPAEAAPAAGASLDLILHGEGPHENYVARIKTARVLWRTPGG